MPFDVRKAEAFLRRELEQFLGLTVLSLASIAYDEACPFEYNNLLFEIRLQIRDRSLFDKATHGLPGTEVLPNTNTAKEDLPLRLIARLSNPAAMLQQTNRVQNEVAAMMIAWKALQQHNLRHLVPAVYYWHAPSDAEKDSSQRSEDFGWMLMEYRPGVTLDEVFHKLDSEERDEVMLQLARVFPALQRAIILETVQGFGGLTFDRAGRIVSGRMTTEPVDGISTYAEFVLARLPARLDQAVECGIFGDEEKSDTLLERVKEVRRYINEIIAAEPELERRTLVYNDFSLSNILIDPTTFQLSGLLDFDFSYIGSPVDDFLSPFHLAPIKHARLSGPLTAATDPTTQAIRRGILTNSWPTQQLDLRDETGGMHSDATSIDYDIVANVRNWYTSLAAVGARVPCQMECMDGLSAIHELLDVLTPRQICEPVVRAGRSDEQRRKDVQFARERIEKVLGGIESGKYSLE